MEIVENTYYYFANDDLQNAKRLLSAGGYRGSVVCSAQAQEKYLKYLYDLETVEPVVKVMQTHSMSYLLGNLKEVMSDSLRSEVIELSDMLSHLEYPTELFIRATEQDAIKSLGIVQQVKEIVDGYLG